MQCVIKIVVMIGLVFSLLEILLQMMQVGFDVVWFNFLYGMVDDYCQCVEMVCEVVCKVGCEIVIMVDFQGLKICVGKFENGKIMFVFGQLFIFDVGCEFGNDECVGFDYKELLCDLKLGDLLLLNDGLIVLIVECVFGDEIYMIVKVGGELLNNKGINCQGGGLLVLVLIVKDMEDICIVMLFGVDFVVVLFLKNVIDMEMVCQFVNIVGVLYGIKLKMIVKIECVEVILVLQSIFDVFDGIMVVCGDFVVEVGNVVVLVLQKCMIWMVCELNKFVIIVMQMMELMIYVLVLICVEVLDVVNVVFDGIDVVMLLVEMVVGKYLVVMIEMMVVVCVEVEKFEEVELDKDFFDWMFMWIDQLIVMGVLFIVYYLGVKVIVVLIELGVIVLWMLCYYMYVLIFVLMLCVGSECMMVLYCNVMLLYVDFNSDCDLVLQVVFEIVVKQGYVQYGDMVVLIVGELMGQVGGINMLKIVWVGEYY